MKTVYLVTLPAMLVLIVDLAQQHIDDAPDFSLTDYAVERMESPSVDAKKMLVLESVTKKDGRIHYDFMVSDPEIPMTFKLDWLSLSLTEKRIAKAKCNDEKSRSFLKNGGMIVYSYRLTNGRVLGNNVIREANCRQHQA